MRFACWLPFIYGLGAGFFVCAGLVEYLQGAYFVPLAFWLLAAALTVGGGREVARLSRREGGSPGLEK